MPLSKFLTILAIVIAAAGATVWLGTVVSAGGGVSADETSAAALGLLLAYVGWRAIATRLK